MDKIYARTITALTPGNKYKTIHPGYFICCNVCKNTYHYDESSNNETYCFALTRTILRFYVRMNTVTAVWRREKIYGNVLSFNLLTPDFIASETELGSNLYNIQRQNGKPVSGKCITCFMDDMFSMQDGIFYSRFSDRFIVATRSLQVLMSCLHKINLFYVFHEIYNYVNSRCTQGFRWLSACNKRLSFQLNKSLCFYEKRRRQGYSHDVSLKDMKKRFCRLTGVRC